MLVQPFSQPTEMLERVGVIFDLDGTLVDETDRPDYTTMDQDPVLYYDDIPLEPVYSEARQWEKQELNADVIYLTGRDQQLWTITRIWLNKQRLFAPLICRPPHIPMDQISGWKAQVVKQLWKDHNWVHVTVYENNKSTLDACSAVLPAFAFTPTLVTAHIIAADGDKQVPEAPLTGLSEKDVVNFKILMGRLSPDDTRWKALLLRKWKSRSQLLDRAQDYIQGRKKRRAFRQMVDQLWLRG